MGRPKQLLPLGDRTVMEQCIRAIAEAGIGDVVVVLGPDAVDIAAAVRGFPVKTVFNRQQGSEMAESARTGLDAVSSGSTGILLCLADHPLVTPGTMWSLADLHAKHPESIIIPSFNRRRGHPTLFPVGIIRDIGAQHTMRDVISAHEREIVYMNTDDEGILLDMDTMEDYERIRDAYQGKDKGQ